MSVLDTVSQCTLLTYSWPERGHCHLGETSLLLLVIHLSPLLSKSDGEPWVVLLVSVSWKPYWKCVAYLFSYRGEPQCGGHFRVGHPEHTADWTAAHYPDHSQEKAPADGQVREVGLILSPQPLKYFYWSYMYGFAGLHCTGVSVYFYFMCFRRWFEILV